MIGKNGVGLLTGHNGVQDKAVLNSANETVAKGIYDAATLSAVDPDLAAVNILSGVTIFGFVGVVTVQNIADADAVLADVKNGKTFYSVTGGRKTGNLATVSLSAAANAYPAGYHAGAASLTAVDADLITGNIKSGITIFGVAGSTNVRDISDADALIGEVKTGETFYAVSGGRKTGTGTKTLSFANETVAAGYYAATTLSAVDADLAVGNIKSGVTIFGFLGTVPTFSAGNATVPDFQANPATGDASTPENLNDGSEGSITLANAIAEYWEVDFGKLVNIKRWRQYGNASNNGDGVFKIIYWDLATNDWIDWVTGILTRGSADWGTLTTETEVATWKIRLIVTTVDSQGNSRLGELEIYF